MEAINYIEMQQALEGKHNKAFDKVYKKLSYQITAFEMEVLYRVLEGLPIEGYNAEGYASNFKKILGIK